MVIKIQTQQTGIPVEIGELTFTFDTSDASIEALIASHQTVVDKISAIEDGDDEGAKKALQEGFDLLLGDGAFKKIYTQTSSTIECIKQLFQLLEGITEELNSVGNGITQQEKAQQYIRAKNNNKSKKKKK